MQLFWNTNHSYLLSTCSVVRHQALVEDQEQAKEIWLMEETTSSHLNNNNNNKCWHQCPSPFHNTHPDTILPLTTFIRCKLHLFDANGELHGHFTRCKSFSYTWIKTSFHHDWLINHFGLYFNVGECMPLFFPSLPDEDGRGSWLDVCLPINLVHLTWAFKLFICLCSILSVWGRFENFDGKQENSFFFFIVILFLWKQLIDKNI